MLAFPHTPSLHAKLSQALYTCVNAIQRKCDTQIPNSSSFSSFRVSSTDRVNLITFAKNWISVASNHHL